MLLTDQLRSHLDIPKNDNNGEIQKGKLDYSFKKFSRLKVYIKSMKHSGLFTLFQELCQ